MEHDNPEMNRRRLLAAVAGFGAFVVACSDQLRPPSSDERPLTPADRAEPHSLGATDADAQQTTAAEALMQDHGVIERVLLIYETAANRLDGDENPPLPVLVDAAELIREFVEDHHEKLEEELVFPRFEQVGGLVDVITTLRLQHVRGRLLTDEIRNAAAVGASTMAVAADSRLSQSLRTYVRMYRPHVATEDTVVFPMLRKLLKEPGYRQLSEMLGEREHARFGALGFETVLRRVAELERAVGIHELAAYTA